MNLDDDGRFDGEPADDEPLARPFLSRYDVPVHHPVGLSRPHPPPVVAPPTSPHAPASHPGAPPVGAGHPEGLPPEGLHPEGLHPEPLHGEVRPYLLTGGRTRGRGAAVSMETVVLATGLRPVRPTDAAGAERARIVELADRPCSVAELAARLHLPLQVALVLVSDLVAEGLLEASAAELDQSADVLFLERLIAGVAAL